MLWRRAIIKCMRATPQLCAHTRKSNVCDIRDHVSRSQPAADGLRQKAAVAAVPVSQPSPQPCPVWQFLGSCQILHQGCMLLQKSLKTLSSLTSWLLQISHHEISDAAYICRSQHTA